MKCCTCGKEVKFLDHLSVKVKVCCRECANKSDKEISKLLVKLKQDLTQKVMFTVR